MGKNIGKKINKILSNKNSLNVPDLSKQFARDAVKRAWKRAIRNTAEANGDLIDNKLVVTTMKVWKTAQQNNLETVINGRNKRIPKVRYLFPKEGYKIIDNLRWI